MWPMWLTHRIQREVVYGKAGGRQKTNQ